MEQVLSGKEEIRGNHWSDSAQQFALTTDWLMAGNYLSAVRSGNWRGVFWRILQRPSWDIPTAHRRRRRSTTRPAQFQENDVFSLVGMRAMGNNYTMSKMLAMVGAGLTFNDDPTDDPNLSNSCNAKTIRISVPIILPALCMHIFRISLAQCCIGCMRIWRILRSHCRPIRTHSRIFLNRQNVTILTARSTHVSAMDAVESPVREAGISTPCIACGMR